MMQDYEKTQLSNSEATQAFTSQPGGEATQLAITVECPVCHTRNPAGGDIYCMECGFLLASAPGEFQASAAPTIGAWLIDSSGREFPIKQGRNSVGRQNADVLLTDPSVSRTHAAVIGEDGAYYVEDLGSTNGTFVDGAQVRQGERTQINSGAQVKFGTYTMEFKATGAPEPPLTEPTMETEVGTDHPETLQAEEGEAVPAPPPVSPEVAEETADITPEEVTTPDVSDEFEIQPGTVEPELIEPPVLAKLVGSDGTEYELREGELTVGRAEDNDIDITDPYVSGHHAKISILADSATITDLGSTNGTLVNSIPAIRNVPVELVPDSTVQLGKLQFKFVRL